MLNAMLNALLKSAGKFTRKWLGFLSIATCLPFSAFAAKKMTIDQLEQTLTIDRAANRKDEVEAQQFADVKLTNRLSSAALNQLIAQSPGPQTTTALHALADASAFLDPPPIEIPAVPAPDIATQKAIMAQTIHYVARTLPSLPNFLATRVTAHYAEAPGEVNQEALAVGGGLYFEGTLQSPIAYRDGRESDDPAMLRDAAVKISKDHGKNARASRAQYTAPPGSGLSSWGEFGPILGIVLVDAAKGKLGWERWEQRDGKRVAVFQFSVDRSVSHYNVQYCCVFSEEVVNGRYGSNNGRGGEGANGGLVKTGPTQVVHQITGYHGHLDVEPETGTVLSITIEADLKAGDPIQRAAMMVEYGPVQIGEKTYYCPTHSVSVSESPQMIQRNPTDPMVQVTRHLLNDVEFKGYHRFGAEITMLSEPEKTEQENREATQGVAANPVPQNSPATPAIEKQLSEATPEAQQAPGSPLSETTLAAHHASPANPANSGFAAPARAPASAATAEEDQEFLIREVNSLPGLNGPGPASASAASSGTAAPDQNFTLKVTTRLVDISMIVDDKHNKPVTNLTQDQIEIYDNGRKQQIRAFRHPSEETPQAAKPADTPAESGPYTNTSLVATEVDSAPDLLLLLIDESHLPFQDLNRARGEVERFLKAARSSSRMALYLVNEKGFRVIQDVTQDHTLVEAKLAAWVPSASAVSQAQQFDARNRQQFDTVRNLSDLNNVNGNNIEVPDYITSVDPQLRLMGDNPLSGSLASMIALARHFAPVPGHKSMVWISGDSVLSDYEDQAVGMEKGSRQFDAALLHTREALNNAKIALYAVDASAIQGGQTDAALENQDVQVNPVSTANSAPGGLAPTRGTGRLTAAMQQDTRAIQGPIRQLAEGTGGLAFNKGGDLKVTLDGIERHASAVYEIAFNPDTPADNKYHTLLVKVPGRKDVKLSYRTGYLYDEEATSTQQRFQQAIWSPQDASSIRLSAEPVPGSDTPTGKSAVKLRITLAGLDLQKKSVGTTHPEDRWTDQLYIFIAERDDAAQKAEVSGETLRISMKQATYDSGMPTGIPYQRIVEPKSKLGSVRVIVIDGNSGKIGSITLPSSALGP